MIENAEVNGKPAELAFTFEYGGRFEQMTWDDATWSWLPSGWVTLPDRFYLNVPASEALTELAFHGNYEIAYRGQDYLTEVYGLQFWETSGWEDLKVTHDTSTDWITDHPSFSLT